MGGQDQTEETQAHVERTNTSLSGNGDRRPPMSGRVTSHTMAN